MIGVGQSIGQCFPSTRLVFSLLKLHAMRLDFGILQKPDGEKAESCHMSGKSVLHEIKVPVPKNKGIYLIDFGY